MYKLLGVRGPTPKDLYKLLGVGLGDGLEVMDRICRKHKHHGYPDTNSLQGGLIEHGNAAAAEYPELDRIESAEMLEC